MTPNVNRLLALAKGLRTLPATYEFDFSTFTGCGETCGTAGCAVGALPLIFPDDFRYTNGFVEPKSGLPTATEWYPGVSEYFGLSAEDADELFMPWGYDLPVTEVTPDMVADRIEARVKGLKDG